MNLLSGFGLAAECDDGGSTMAGAEASTASAVVTAGAGGVTAVGTGAVTTIGWLSFQCRGRVR
jgi:hypothetical protein